jgi:D-3-phosphoglycerate dehydrogenase / 2-oxoglutarate reductase
MNLICPTKKYFSEKVQFKFNNLVNCDFLNITQNKFNKIFYKYEIILLRFNTILPYKKNSKIKYILSPTTGINHIDKKYFGEKNIKIITLKDKLSFLKNINATSEFTILLILFSLRNKLNFKSKKNFYGEIHNKNIGIIGLGRIGIKVAKILKSFGANIKYYDIKKIMKKDFKYVKLNELLKNSDILTIHIPLSKKNKNFINKEKLSLMKKNALLINTSRGEIINESHLINHIKKNKNFKYSTDVLQNENTNKVNQIYKLSKKSKNIFVSPHVAGMTEESVEATDNFIYLNFLKFFKNEKKA